MSVAKVSTQCSMTQSDGAAVEPRRAGSEDGKRSGERKRSSRTSHSSARRKRHRKTAATSDEENSSSGDSSSSISSEDSSRSSESSDSGSLGGRRKKERQSLKRRRHSSPDSSSFQSDSDTEARDRSSKRRHRKHREHKTGHDRDGRGRSKKDKKRRSREKSRRDDDDKRNKKKRMPRKKKHEKNQRGKSGPVTDSWGKYGIIKEIDMWSKRPEFSAWLAEVKKVNLETMPAWEEKQMFKEYMEDFNTATLAKKYYDLDAYHRRKLMKELKRGISKQPSERTEFNDEEQRRQELKKERELRKEAEVEALKRSMQSGMAQAMKEQAQLREEMQYQYRLGNFEAANAIQRRLDPAASGAPLK